MKYKFDIKRKRTRSTLYWNFTTAAVVCVVLLLSTDDFVVTKVPWFFCSYFVVLTVLDVVGDLIFKKRDMIFEKLKENEVK